MRNYDLSPFFRQWIGFDKLANALMNTAESQTFPPYNIEKSDDNHYRITLALAGFRQEDLEIELEHTVLRVKGTPVKPETEPKWLHQGLVIQPFNLSFTLAEHMEVSGASFTNGLLHIDLVRNIPEALAPQRIAIGQPRAQEDERVIEGERPALSHSESNTDSQ
ncbi:small heat shock chaperone IbpB [Cronobacter dublinensis]|uniref:small heat shock chaperone IbpB n=1 Tax=Cronobacter dublinensis TaxID=413497 RepID=UPI00300DFFBD